jgi:hypothetical protein
MVFTKFLFGCVPSGFEKGQICVGRNNYLPGNGIHRDVTPTPRRRLRPDAGPPEKT